MNDIINVFKRIFILSQYDSTAYIMRYSAYHNSPFKGMYNILAAWSNQFALLRSMTFREFCTKRGISGKVYEQYKNDPDRYLKDGYKKGLSWIYMEDFENQYPLVAETFFDLGSCAAFDQKANTPPVRSTVNKTKYKIETERISCRVDSKKLSMLKQIYGNVTNTELIDRLIAEKVSETFNMKVSR